MTQSQSDFLLTRKAFGFGDYLEANSLFEALKKSINISDTVLKKLLGKYGVPKYGYMILLKWGFFGEWWWDWIH